MHITQKRIIYLKLILIMFLLFLMCGCVKNAFTKEDFLLNAEENAYIIEHNKTGYEKYNYVKDVYYAVNRENAYDIQFLELESDDYAKKFYDLNKKELMNYVNNDTYIKNINRSNYACYHIENDDSYMLVLRSKNNIIYLEAPINYILEIEEFLSQLSIDF